MKDFGVHKDLDVYKALLQVFPEGKMVPANQWQVCIYLYFKYAEFLSTFAFPKHFSSKDEVHLQRLFIHYPQQQFCCVRLLDEMEWHGSFSPLFRANSDL